MSNTLLPTATLRSTTARSWLGQRKPLLATLLVALTILAWIPSFLLLQHPSADQVWESFGIWSACTADQFQLGWAGPDSTTTMGAFTASLPAAGLQWLSCQLTHHTPLNPLQSFLVLGLVLTFLLSLMACRRAGFRPATSLLVAFLITTAPSSFSRLGHLSLATLWPVIPGLLACHGLWQAMLPLSKPSGWYLLAGHGALAAALCFPAQDYYVFFVFLLLGTSYCLLLFLATTRTSQLDVLGTIAKRGLSFLCGAALLVVLAYLPKLLASTGGDLPTLGPHPGWPPNSSSMACCLSRG